MRKQWKKWCAAALAAVLMALSHHDASFWLQEAATRTARRGISVLFIMCKILVIYDAKIHHNADTDFPDCTKESQSYIYTFKFVQNDFKYRQILTDICASGQI